MPNMHGDAVDQCHEITPGERPVLALVAQGKSDLEIEAELGLTDAAVRSLVRRFRERTGLSGRALVVWCHQHRACCISIAK